MGQLRTIESDLLELGYQIVCISPDSAERVAEFNKKGDYAYTLLSDPKLDAAKAFGLAFRVDDEKFAKFLGKHSGQSHGLLVVPAVYILDDDREVHFQYVNPDYKVRIDAPTILAAARAIAKD